MTKYKLGPVAGCIDSIVLETEVNFLDDQVKKKLFKPCNLFILFQNTVLQIKTIKVTIKVDTSFLRQRAFRSILNTVKLFAALKIL